MQIHLTCFFPFIFVALRFPIKATRAIEELKEPASKLSTVKLTRAVTKMKSVKTDTLKQAPGACKDAKAAVGDVASADKIRTPMEQQKIEGECALEMLVTHDKIPRLASARNATSTNARCEFLELVKHTPLVYDASLS